jgi:hypothetical protein
VKTELIDCGNCPRTLGCYGKCDKAMAKDTHTLPLDLPMPEKHAPGNQARRHIDANELERMAKERPDAFFLKGSGVLKLIGAIRQLEAAARAAIRYDDEIQKCANDPDAMASHCTAEGDTLDTLYADWISKARAALAGVQGGKQ